MEIKQMCLKQMCLKQVLNAHNMHIPYTVETAYKVAICPRGNVLYMRIYLIANLKLLGKGVFGLEFIYFISDLTL